eukprot:8099689-Pyramimonas_sp.AAC.1
MVMKRPSGKSTPSAATRKPAADGPDTGTEAKEADDVKPARQQPSAAPPSPTPRRVPASASSPTVNPDSSPSVLG